MPNSVDRKVKEKGFYLGIVWVIVTILSAFTLVIILKEISSFTMFLFALISILLFIVSFKLESWSLALRLLAVFIIFHLIVFPNIYLDQLEKNPKSFEFDNYIKSIEKEKSLLDAKIEYEPELLDFKKRVAGLILEDSSSILEEPMEILSRDDIYFLENFIIYGKGRPRKEIMDNEIMHPTKNLLPKDILVVCDKEGKYITDFFQLEHFYFNHDKRSIKEFFRDMNGYLQGNIVDYSNLKQAIQEQNQFWTYGKIFPYVLNVLNTSNINPKSRTANIIFFVHYLIIAVFVISLLTSSLDSLIKRKNPK